MTKEKEEALKNIPMEIFTKVNLQIIKLMAKEYINGEMESYMMANGIWEPERVMVFGEGSQETAI